VSPLNDFGLKVPKSFLAGSESFTPLIELVYKSGSIVHSVIGCFPTIFAIRISGFFETKIEAEVGRLTEGHCM